MELFLWQFYGDRLKVVWFLYNLCGMLSLIINKMDKIKVKIFSIFG